MQLDCLKARQSALAEFLHCHGLDGNDQLTALATMALSGMKYSALAGMAVGAAGAHTGERENPVVKLLAQSMLAKSQLLGTELPDKDVQAHIEVEVEKQK
jgi:hypothetical protein